MVKKDRQPVLFYASLSQKYVTHILPNSLTKTTVAHSVYCANNFTESATIRETGEIRETRTPYFPIQLQLKVAVVNYKDFLIYLN